MTYAIKELGLRTFAVFYPNSPYGLDFKNLFTQEVTQKGGKVLGAWPIMKNKPISVRRLKVFSGSRPHRKRAPDEQRVRKSTRSGFTVDGLFIPDTHDRVGLILSQMAYFDVSGLTFLGTNAWNDPILFRLQEKQQKGRSLLTHFLKNPLPFHCSFCGRISKDLPARARDP